MSEDDQDDYYGELTPILGNLVIAWNATNFGVLEVFVKLTGLPWEKAAAIFFALRNDSTQRDVTIALIPVCLRDREELANRLKQSLNDLGRLAGERNAAIHTIWAVQMPERKTFAYNQHPRLEEDFLQQFRTLIDRLDELAERLEDLAGEL